MIGFHTIPFKNGCDPGGAATGETPVVPVRRQDGGSPCGRAGAQPSRGGLGGRTGCRDWFREHQWGEGPSGETDGLARAKGLSVNDVVNAGVLFSKGGKTSLVKWQDYPDDYDPTEDAHRPVWEVCHHLVRIHQRRGTGAAGEFLSMVQGQGESARQLAYLLYTLCERKGLTEDARVYNELATAWNDIVTSSIENAKPVLKQAVLDL